MCPDLIRAFDNEPGEMIPICFDTTGNVWTPIWGITDHPEAWAMRRPNGAPRFYDRDKRRIKR